METKIVFAVIVIAVNALLSLFIGFAFYFLPPWFPGMPPNIWAIAIGSTFFIAITVGDIKKIINFPGEAE